MMREPDGITTCNRTGSGLWPTTYMNIDGPFQLACAVASTLKVPESVLANTRYLIVRSDAPSGYNRHNEPFSRSHRIGRPPLVALNAVTLRAKKNGAYRPGDHTG